MVLYEKPKPQWSGHHTGLKLTYYRTYSTVVFYSCLLFPTAFTQHSCSLKIQVFGYAVPNDTSLYFRTRQFSRVEAAFFDQGKSYRFFFFRVVFYFGLKPVWACFNVVNGSWHLGPLLSRWRYRESLMVLRDTPKQFVSWCDDVMVLRCPA